MDQRHRRGMIRRICWRPLCAILLVWLALPHAGAAQDRDPIQPDVAAGEGGGLLGRAPEQPVSMGSMVLTVHPFIDQSKYDLISDRMDGGYVRVSQLFLAGFRNSYGDQSWVVAVERHWGSASLWRFDVGVGYRVGIITGYDERLVGLAGHTPVLPLGGIVGWVNLGPVGTNVYWAYRAISLEMALRCC